MAAFRAPQNFRPLKLALKRFCWLRDPHQISWLPSWLERAAVLRRGASVDGGGRGQEVVFLPYTRASRPPQSGLSMVTRRKGTDQGPGDVGGKVQVSGGGV